MTYKLLLDSIICIKNGYISKLNKVTIKKSKQIIDMLMILYRKGFIKNFNYISLNKIDVFLKYTSDDLFFFFREFKILTNLRRPMYSKNYNIFVNYNKSIVVLNSIKGLLSNSDLFLSTYNYIKNKLNFNFLNIYSNKYAYKIVSNFNNNNIFDLFSMNTLFFFDKNIRGSIKGSFYYYFKVDGLNYLTNYSIFIMQRYFKKQIKDYYLNLVLNTKFNNGFNKTYDFFFSIFYNLFIYKNELENFKNSDIFALTSSFFLNRKNNNKNFDSFFLFNYIQSKKILGKLKTYNYNNLSLYDFNLFNFDKLNENNFKYKFFYQKINKDYMLNNNFSEFLGNNTDICYYISNVFGNSFDVFIFNKIKMKYRINFIRKFFFNFSFVYKKKKINEFIIKKNNFLSFFNLKKQEVDFYFIDYMFRSYVYKFKDIYNKIKKNNKNMYNFNNFLKNYFNYTTLLLLKIKKKKFVSFKNNQLINKTKSKTFIDINNKNKVLNSIFSFCFL